MLTTGMDTRIGSSFFLTRDSVKPVRYNLFPATLSDTPLTMLSREYVSRCLTVCGCSNCQRYPRQV
jgi:hypothetical protein